MLCYLLGSWNVGFEGITVLWDLSRCWVRGYTYYWVITWLEKTLIIRDNFWLWMSKLYVFFSLSAFLLTRKYDFVTNQVSGLGTNWFKIQSKTFDCNQVSSQLSFSRLQKFNYNFSGSTATQFSWLQSHHQHERCAGFTSTASKQEILGLMLWCRGNSTRCLKCLITS